MADAAKGVRARPMSPHLSIWRWHITMYSSIFNRATGVALYVGALIVAGWAVSLAAGPAAYGCYKSLLGSPLGLVVMFGLTVAFFYHLSNGVRHLVWDAGEGFELKTANAASVFVFAFTAVASIVVWVIAYMIGAI